MGDLYNNAGKPRGVVLDSSAYLGTPHFTASVDGTFGLLYEGTAPRKVMYCEVFTDKDTATAALIKFAQARGYQNFRINYEKSR